MPAGARLKYRSNVPQYAHFVFEGVDPTFYDRASAVRDEGRHNVIVAGESYGQGSSREHAAMCPMYLGVKMVIAKGIERIHQANLVNFGILPCLFVDSADYDRIEQGDQLVADNFHKALKGDGVFTVRDATKKFTFQVKALLSKRQREIVLAGGLLPYTKQGK